MSHPGVKWLRRQIEARKALAENAIRIGNAAEWVELSSGVLMTCPADDPQSNLDGIHPLGDSTLTRLMEANDPRDTIARCEAELRLLDEYAARDGDVGLMLGDETLRQREWAGLRLAVGIVAAGYRHWDGYAEHWGDEQH